MEKIIERKLLEQSPEIFDSLGKWRSFLEISTMRAKFQIYWLENVTKMIREELVKDLPEEWVINKWDPDPRVFDADTAMGLQLKEFGSNSLILGFQWCYEFHLYNLPSSGDIISSAKIATELQDSHYAPILECFAGSPDYKGPNDMAWESRNFTFGSPHDGCIPRDEFPWFAAHNTKSLVDQAVEKVKRLTGNPVVTELIRELQTSAGIRRTRANLD